MLQGLQSRDITVFHCVIITHSLFCTIQLYYFLSCCRGVSCGVGGGGMVPCGVAGVQRAIPVGRWAESSPHSMPHTPKTPAPKFLCPIPTSRVPQRGMHPQRPTSEKAVPPSSMCPVSFPSMCKSKICHLIRWKQSNAREKKLELKQICQVLT